jgi:Peptidase M60, enhancin and enhancin-like
MFLKVLAIGLAVFLTSLPTASRATVIDAKAGTAEVDPQPDANAEALRLDRRPWADEVPLGRFVEKGARLRLSLLSAPPKGELTLLIGFRPMWSGGPDIAEYPLTGRGPWDIDDAVSGPVFLRHIGKGAPVQVQIEGGTVLPLYQQGITSSQEWNARLSDHGDAPFVQLLGPRSIITLPMDVLRRTPIPNPKATLAMLDRILGWEDELSGLDASSGTHAPSPNRMHFLVDTLATKADRAQFYMYAGDRFIGMLDDNTGDLTDPALLARNWAIWHEIGHQHQQTSWTWGSLTEVNVNTYSLYVQDHLGLPSRLDDDDGSGSIRDQARAYLASNPTDYMDDDTDVFIKLVMLDQLRQAYGWDIFKALNRATRESALSEDATDQDRVDHFVVTLCQLTGHDLRGFFAAWNLAFSKRANAAIEAMALPAPPVDPATLF